jgi:uncharacterized RDD family membrane protein YckC
MSCTTFALESRDGQTIGKRHYGIRVLSIDDQRPTSKAMACDPCYG